MPALRPATCFSCSTVRKLSFFRTWSSFLTAFLLFCRSSGRHGGPSCFLLFAATFFCCFCCFCSFFCSGCLFLDYFFLFLFNQGLSPPYTLTKSLNPRELNWYSSIHGTRCWCEFLTSQVRLFPRGVVFSGAGRSYNFYSNLFHTSAFFSGGFLGITLHALSTNHPHVFPHHRVCTFVIDCFTGARVRLRLCYHEVTRS